MCHEVISPIDAASLDNPDIAFTGVDGVQQLNCDVIEAESRSHHNLPF